MTHFLQRTALIALATGALGACATVEPMGPAPVSQPPAPAPTPPVVREPAPAADAPVAVAPAAPVEQRTLDAPPPARTAPTPAPAAEPVPRPFQPSVRRAPPPAPAEPAYRNVTTRTVTGRVIDVQGRAKSYTVRKGDTLEEISDRLGASVAELREINGLKKRAVIQPGQVIEGPPEPARAYVAVQGDTLYSIARRFAVTPEALRDENDLGRSASLRTGQRIRLPDGYRDRGPLTATSRVRVDAPTAAPQRPAADDREPLPPASDETAAPAGPSYRTVTTRSVTGRVVDVEGPAATYRVRKGDNLTEVADKLGVSVEELRDLNDMTKRRSTIHPGQVLKGPSRTERAYVVVSGDTLAAIGRRFGVSAEALRDENGLSRNAALRAGQKVRLPSGARDRGPITTSTRIPVAPTQSPSPAPVPRRYTPPVVQPAPLAPPPQSEPTPAPAQRPVPRPFTPPVQTQPTATQPPATVPRPYQRPLPPPPRSAPRTYAPIPPSGPIGAPTASPALRDDQISSLGSGRFIWPVQGQVISNFGPKTTGQRNDGVNISAAVGASVRATASGEVVYAGDQVPGFGNLVLIKHADGWVSAYGHLSRVLVKMKQGVSQGQEIGLAGQTGGVSEPQLHFEIRYAPSPQERAKPIDPQLVLPR